MLASVFHIFFVTLIGAKKIQNFSPRNGLRSGEIETLNLNESYFNHLESYYVNADVIPETQYPWIARVVHSRKATTPHLCTAICIDEAIFITAARCIFTLKVHFTRIIYMTKKLTVLAFIFPSEPSTQFFDDIGFIVTESQAVDGMWAIIELFDTTNRTDQVFKWFNELVTAHGPTNYKVLGFAVKKGLHKLKSPKIPYELTELSVVVGLDLCSDILTQYGKLNGFHVPCYHSCTFQEFLGNVDKCANYHGVEGGALFDTLSNKLIGVATWGTYFPQYELPVGFSVANSENFFKDFSCARTIRDDSGLLVTKGYYQNLCDH